MVVAEHIDHQLRGLEDEVRYIFRCTLVFILQAISAITLRILTRRIMSKVRFKFEGYTPQIQIPLIHDT